MTPERRHWIAAALLLAAGLAMRTFGAWVYEFAHTSDHGIICLMVKHMLEGKEFPVFFYGLPYMGSLEPVLSAGLCRVFGLTGFWINMGTALAAFAFLPLVYAWGRGAAGRVAGLAALAFCVIGPPQYFQFESWADGGYAAIPLLTCALLVYGMRLLRRDLEGAPASHAEYACLGLIAGLGWWQSPLLIPAFLVCGFLFLAVLRLRLFSLRLFSGAAGFVIGSLPLWIWNLRNHWQTFDMVKTHDRPPLLEGLRLFYVNRMSSLMEFQRGSDVFQYAMIGLLGLLILLAVFRLAEGVRKSKRAEVLYLAAAILYLVLYSILFGRSRFARVDAVRYVLILIPILGVLIGAATAWLTARFRILGWIPLVVLIALQAKELPKRPPERERTAAFLPKAVKLGEFLRANGIKHVYTDYQVRGANHGLNYLLNEEFVFSPVSRERVRPYARAMEQAENPAVLNDHMGFSNFLRMTGATCETNTVEGMRVHYNARPPADSGVLAIPFRENVREVEPGSWAAWLEWREPVEMSGFQMVCEPDFYPMALSVDALLGEHAKETTILTQTPVTKYFWSGPRFYWGGDAYRLECRFPPVRASELRIRMKMKPGVPLRIRRLQLILSADEEPVSLDEVAALIRERGIRNVHADRWESVQLASRLGPEVELSLPRHVFERNVLTNEVIPDAKTAILASLFSWGVISHQLYLRDVPFKMTSAGGRTLFTFPSTLPPHAARPCLLWQGGGLVPVDDRRWAMTAYQEFRNAQAKHEESNALYLAHRAAALMPDYRPALDAKAAAWEAEGEQQQAGFVREEMARVWEPDIRVNALFEEGIRLAGVKTDMMPARMTATGSMVTSGGMRRFLRGGILTLKLLWRWEKAPREGVMITVRFLRGSEEVLPALYYPLPVERAEGYSPDDLLVDEHAVVIPKDLKAGDVQVQITLSRPGPKGGRLKIAGTGEKSLVLPEPITFY